TRSATAPESARGRTLDELTRRKLRIGAGRGSLHRLVRSLSADTKVKWDANRAPYRVTALHGWLELPLLHSDDRVTSEIRIVSLENSEVSRVTGLINYTGNRRKSRLA